MGRKKQSLADKIRKHVSVYPKEKAADTASKFNVGVQYVYTLRSQVKRDKGGTKTGQKWMSGSLVQLSPLPITMEEPAADAVSQNLKEFVSDPVNHPAHYKVGGIETIDFIEAKGLNYRLGNVVKYVTRADHKGDRVEDLNKALWYLKREIDLSSRTT